MISSAIIQQGNLPVPTGCSVASAQCNSTARDVLSAVMQLASEKSSDGRTVRLSDLQSIIQQMSRKSGPLAPYYDNRARSCLGAAKVAELDQRRTNAIGRIVLDPLERLLDDPHNNFQRSMVSRLVDALRMMIGCDQYEILQERAVAVAHSFRNPQSGVTDWKAVVASDDGRLLSQEALVALADSFKRFDIRKDWMLLFLNTNPSTAALGSSAFVVRSPEVRSGQKMIGENQFSTLMLALFSVVHPQRFNDQSALAFVRQFGRSPEAVFGTVIVNLTRSQNRS